MYVFLVWYYILVAQLYIFLYVCDLTIYVVNMADGDRAEREKERERESCDNVW